MNEYISNLLFPFIFLITFVIIRVLYIILTFIPGKHYNVNVVKEYFDRHAFYSDKGVMLNLLRVLYNALSLRYGTLGFNGEGTLSGGVIEDGEKKKMVGTVTIQMYTHDFISNVVINPYFRIGFTLVAIVLLIVAFIFIYFQIPILSSCSAICLSIATAKFGCSIIMGIYALIVFYFDRAKTIKRLFIEPISEKTDLNYLEPTIGKENITAIIDLKEQLNKETNTKVKNDSLYKKMLLLSDKLNEKEFSALSYTSLAVSDNLTIKMKENPIIHFINSICLNSGTRYLFIVTLICMIVNSSYSMAYTLSVSGINTSNSPVVNDVKYTGLSCAFLLVLLWGGWLVYDSLITFSEFLYRYIYNKTDNTFFDYILEIYRLSLFDCISHMDVVFRKMGFKERAVLFFFKCFCPIFVAVVAALFITVCVQSIQINADSNNSSTVADQLYSQPNIKLQYDLGFMSTMKSTTIVSVIIISVFYYLEYIGYLKLDLNSLLYIILCCMVVISIIIPIVMYIANK